MQTAQLATGTTIAAEPRPENIRDDKLSLLNQIASSVAHELSVPLTTIVATAQNVLAFSAREQQGGKAAISPFHEELQQIISEARRAADIAGNLLAFTRQEPPQRGPERGRRTEPRPKLVTDEHETDRDSQPAVLLVDDEPAIRRSVGRFLQLSGYDVAIASSGHEAAHALRAGHFDAIVSDLRMPELSGEELFELLKHEFPDMTSRVVFTSGDLMRDETKNFIRQSGCPALPKPYDLPDLLEVVALLCNNDRGEDDS